MTKGIAAFTILRQNDLMFAVVDPKKHLVD